MAKNTSYEECVEVSNKLKMALSRAKAGLETRQKVEAQVKEWDDERRKYAKITEDLTNAKRLLITVADKNTEEMLRYVSAVINKVLAEMFKGTGSGYEVSVEKSTYRSRYPHMNIKIVELPSGIERDLKLQNGEGIRQVISFLYVVCLIEVSECRKLLVMDEILNGLSKEASVVVGEIIRVFAEGGFQFLMVDHGNYQKGCELDDIIQHIEVRKIDGVSRVV